MKSPRFAPMWAIVFATASLTFAHVGKTAPPDRDRLTIARYRTFAELLAEGEKRILLGEIEEAIALYTEAQTLTVFLKLGQIPGTNCVGMAACGAMPSGFSRLVILLFP